MTYSDELREVLKRWECPGGVPFLSPHWDKFGKVWDIAYGHVIKAGEETRDITLDEAEMLLDWDLHFFDDAVSKAITVDLAQCQHDALVMRCYNTGSSEKRFLRMVAMINLGDDAGALAEWPNSNTASGVVNNGLIRRRDAEIAMWNGEYRRP